MEEDEYIGNERELGSHQIWGKALISMRKLIGIISKGNIERIRPNPQQKTSKSSFWKPLYHEASCPLWENFPLRDQHKYLGRNHTANARLLWCNLPSTRFVSVTVALT